MNWQPIETVPLPASRHEMGPRVLVFIPDYDYGKSHVCEARAYRDGTYHDPVYDEWDGKGATHWMPLPEPPN